MPVRLFVGNLSYEATEAELREHFSSIGPVSYCYLPTDRETGRPRGFAFVEFANDSHAQDAISRLNNQLFRGRPLAVKEAQPRESRPPGSGPPRPFSSPGGPRPFTPSAAPSAGAGPARRSESDRFGPDAPPKGKKKTQYRAAEQRGPKGPIRTKTDNRIYSAFDDDEGGTDFDGDNFATSIDDTPDDKSDEE
jgi:cold-inducible RNA-binding protein